MSYSCTNCQRLGGFNISVSIKVRFFCNFVAEITTNNYNNEENFYRYDCSNGFCSMHKS